MRVVRYSLFVTFLAGFFISYVLWHQRDILLVSFFDVGQGDSTYIRTPSGADILIDAGPDLLTLHRLGRRMPWYDRRLELLVLTHPDSDHITAAVEILRRYEVLHILLPNVANDTPVFHAIHQEIEQQHSDVHFAAVGESLQLDKVRIDVLHPSFAEYPNNASMPLDARLQPPTNDLSVVMLLTYGANRFLFTGDATRKLEETMLRRGLVTQVQFLKVAHHGSRTSTHWEFLEQVRPEIAVISVGQENHFGHPHREVLERLQNIGATILRTDIYGTIHAECDLQQCRWSFEKHDAL